MWFFSIDADSLTHIEFSDDVDPTGAYVKMSVPGSG